jgi:Dyp-type peroxidase family
MDPNFYGELNLKSNWQTVAAGGPCNWQDGDAWAEVKDVTVTQGSVAASSGGSTTVRRDSDRGWWLDVSSSGQFNHGTARARAIAFVRRTDGTTYQYPWSVDVQLVQLDPPLALDEIQGNILAGFNKDYASFLFFALPDDQARAREWLRGLVDQVATTEEVKQFNDLFRAIRSRRGREGVVEATWMNLAFTYEGLEKLGLPQRELGQFPEEFRQGMRDRAELIGDVDGNDPSQWPNGLGAAAIHALMVVAADSDDDRKREVEYFTRDAEDHGLTLVFRQDGTTRREAPDREHFGFRDGISQPGIRGLTVPLDPNEPDEGEPGQQLIAPGEFVLGYPLQGPLAASSPTPNPPTPAGDPPNPQLELTRNGSYLVFRRLRQDVTGFWDFVTTQAARQERSVDLLAAKLVGRYLSGAPLEGADDAAEDPGRMNPDVLEKSKINAFAYSTDPHGMQVPRAAHIRKTHPRAQKPPGEQEGRRRRILRRGISFGESFDPDSEPDSPSGPDPQFPSDRGLCFVCYQRSIRDQFEFIQHEWANQDSVPEPGDGVDPVASQASQSSPERLFRLPGGAIDPVRLPKQWVTTTGGEYFFSPSISALTQLSS